MLMGIVSKNSILLVEYAIVGLRDRGLSLSDAVLEACHARARPVVMTTAAMTAGMLPMAFGFGANSSFRQPMAAVVIGGLLSSTALSLWWSRWLLHISTALKDGCAGVSVMPRTHQTV